MKVILCSFLIAISSLLGGCKKCLNKKGAVQTVQHSLEPFNELDIEGKFNITLVQNTKNRITFLAHQGIIELLRYEVVDKKLTLINDNKCSNINGYDDWVDIKIEMDSLSYGRFSVPGILTNQGILKWTACSLFIDNCNLETNLNINMNQFEITLDGGSSTINLSGNCNRTEYYNNGVGHIYGKDLISKKLYIYSIGTGIHEGTAKDYFATSLHGSAVAHYYGNPTTVSIDIVGNEGAEAIKL
tara:strand:- start:7691 stop:8419 length:729 start_codon:yes stop_codon:yes gene_type:complete